MHANRERNVFNPHSSPPWALNNLVVLDTNARVSQSSSFLAYKKRTITKNGDTYPFWAISKYTADHALEKASWRRLTFALRSTVPTNGSKGQGTPIISYSTSVSPTFGFNCTYKWRERSIISYSTSVSPTLGFNCTYKWRERSIVSCLISVSPTFGFSCTYKWLERSLFRY